MWRLKTKIRKIDIKILKHGEIKELVEFKQKTCNSDTVSLIHLNMCPHGTG